MTPAQEREWDYYREILDSLRATDYVAGVRRTRRSHDGDNQVGEGC